MSLEKVGGCTKLLLDGSGAMMITMSETLNLNQVRNGTIGAGEGGRGVLVVTCVSIPRSSL